MDDLVRQLLDALEEPRKGETRSVESLERQVAALQRTVATLAERLRRAGALTDDDAHSLLGAARRPRWRPEDEIAPDSDDDAPPAIIASPYRGAAPTGKRGCAACGKPLEEDDPELTLPTRGKVCALCFARG
jgi:hypothetical protein